MSGNQMDRNDYSVGASQAVQGNFEAVASELEAALDRRDADVKQAMRLIHKTPEPVWKSILN